MFKILKISNCTNITDYIHIEVLFDNDTKKIFCSLKSSKEINNCEIELYYVINNIFNIDICHCEQCVCTINIDRIRINDNKNIYMIYYCNKTNTYQPYIYNYFNQSLNTWFKCCFKKLSELVEFLRERRPELLKPVKLAIHEE